MDLQESSDRHGHSVNDFERQIILDFQPLKAEIDHHLIKNDLMNDRGLNYLYHKVRVQFVKG